MVRVSASQIFATPAILLQSLGETRGMLLSAAVSGQSLHPTTRGSVRIYKQGALGRRKLTEHDN
jgi:hypothetical protein